MEKRIFTRAELESMCLPNCWHSGSRLKRREGEAEAVHREHVDSGRWNNILRLIFRAPDDGKCYEIHYQEGATEYQDDTDPWFDEDTVEAVEVALTPVVRAEWKPVRRGMMQLGNAMVDIECVRPFPPAQGIADEAAHGCWEPNFPWLKEKAEELRLQHAGIIAPDTGLPDMLITYLTRAETARQQQREAGR